MMNCIFFIAACIGIVSALPATVDTSLYTKTPFGHLLSHCVHEIPNGAHIQANDNGSTTVSVEGAFHGLIPVCNTTLGPLRLSFLPPDYDGWLQYTAVNVSKLGLTGGFDVTHHSTSTLRSTTDPSTLIPTSILTNVCSNPNPTPDRPSPTL